MDPLSLLELAPLAIFGADAGRTTARSVARPPSGPRVPPGPSASSTVSWRSC